MRARHVGVVTVVAATVVALAVALTAPAPTGAAAARSGGLLALLRVGPCLMDDCVQAIWVVTPAGTGLHRLTVNADAPAWSPDGRTLAYNDGDDRLQLIKADGTGKRAVAGVFHTIYRPAWSPDRRAIAVVSDAVGPATTIRIVHLNDGHVSSFRGASDFTPTGLDWSPDGAQLLVESNFGSIYLVNLDGSGRRLLVRKGAYPRWSPDGGKILYVSAEGDAIDVISKRGGRPQVVYKRANGPEIFAATWSPDATAIAFADRAGLHTLDLRTRRTRPIALRPQVCTSETCQAIEWQPPAKR